MGDALLCLWRAVPLDPPDPPLTMGTLCGLLLGASLSADTGEVGGESPFVPSTLLAAGVGVAQGRSGDGGALADLLRLLSISSRTIFTSKSAGSSTPALLTVRLLNCSARRSQP